MKTNLRYTVEIITNADDLTEVFSLRYKVYRKEFPALTKHHKEPFEWDEFDIRSIHLGLYCENAEGKKLAGYCRLIIPMFFSESYSHFLINNSAKYILNKEASKEKLAFIKQLQCDEDHSKLNTLFKKLEAENKFYIEGSRLIIDDKHKNIQVFSFFMAAIFAIGKFLDVNYFFVSCAHHHAAFYKNLGMDLLTFEVNYGTESNVKLLPVFGAFLNNLNLSQTPAERLYIQMHFEGCITLNIAA